MPNPLNLINYGEINILDVYNSQDSPKIRKLSYSINRFFGTYILTLCLPDWSRRNCFQKLAFSTKLDQVCINNI